MMEWLASTGASIISGGVYLGIFAAATWIGWKLSERIAPKDNDTAGCIIMWVLTIIVGAGLAAVFLPAIDALNSVACKGSDDYRACMEYD